MYDALDTLVADRAIAAYGVSVETCAEALTAIARPGVASVQIILNAFRLKPLDEVLPAARGPGSASSPGCRWPAACCRAGTTRRPTSAPTTTATTTAAARPSTSARPSPGSTSRPGWTPPGSSPPGAAGATLAQSALRWIVDQPGVSVVIPGARNPEQARANAAAADLAPLGGPALDAIENLYDKYFRASVHARW